MGRNKIALKAEPISISMPKDLIVWIKQHPTFKLGEFVKMHLREHIGFEEEVETLEKTYNMTTKDNI
jgi:hypothetical protein